MPCKMYLLRTITYIHTYISWFTSHFPHVESDGSWLHTADVSKRSGLVGLHPSVARLFYRPVQFHPRSFWVGQVRGTLMDLHLLIQPLMRSKCPYQHRRFALNMFSSGAMLKFSINSSLLTSWLGLVLYIQRSMALSLRTSLAVVSLVGAQVSLPCSMNLLTQLL